MPKLKTFITRSGFYELAIAAPSMKAAVEAWGIKSDAFRRGWAQQIEDTNIVRATMAKPGVVLCRAVGTKGKFTQHPKLPTIKTRKASHVEKIAANETNVSTKKEKQQKEVRRQKGEEVREEKRRRKLKNATITLERAEKRHEIAIKKLEEGIEHLEKRRQKENDRWDKEKKRLMAEL